MTPRRSLRAAVHRRLRAAAKSTPPPPEFPLPPAPTKLQQTSPSLTDHVRMLYEETAVPMCEIARLAGVSERSLYRYVERGGWRRRYPLRDNGAAARRGRARKQRPGPPQPRGAGGRFVPPAEAGKPHPSGLKALDPDGAARAAAACEHRGLLAGEAMARALALYDAEARARVFVLMVGAMRDLAAIADGELSRVRRQRRVGTPR